MGVYEIQAAIGALKAIPPTKGDKAAEREYSHSMNRKIAYDLPTSEHLFIVVRLKQ
jgi:hypothetical protein